MKKYIVLTEYNGRYSAFNTSLFESKKEAEQYLKFYQAKYKAEAAICDKFWGKESERATELPLRIGEITI